MIIRFDETKVLADLLKTASPKNWKEKTLTRCVVKD